MKPDFTRMNLSIPLRHGSMETNIWIPLHQETGS